MPLPKAGYLLPKAGFFLLISWGFLLCGGLVSAQTEELAVTIETSPEEPRADGAWVITVLADHPAPGEVVIEYPPLPRGLTLESVRTGARVIGGRRWTAVEFWLIPQRPGSFTVGPFEVRAPEKRFRSAPIVGYIRGTGGAYPPYCVWESAPGGLRIGEAAEFVLRLMNWDTRLPAPSAGIPAPEEAILEELPVSSAEASAGIILRLRVIPLAGEVFTLAAGTLRYAGGTIGVPRLTIPLKEPIPPGPAPEPPPAPAKPAMPAPQWPAVSVSTGPIFRESGETLLETAETLWRNGQIPEALALLRRNERDRLWGRRLVPLRREAEARLGFDALPDEGFRPAWIAGAGGFCLLLGIWLCRGKPVTSRFSRGYTCIVIILLISAGICGAKSVFLPIRGPVVLKTADAYRIPDTNGRVSAHFTGGHAVMIRFLSAEWGYIEALDGRIGWVLRENIIIY